MKMQQILMNAIGLLIGFAACMNLGCQLGPEGLQASDSIESASTNRAAGQINIIVSVDWEGVELSQQNLDALAEFRRDFPEVKLLHYLNAAYLTKPNVNPSTEAEKMRSVIRNGDELGLHIHGWRSLFEAAGVAHRTTNKWTPSTPKYDFPYHECSDDCGHEIPISIYSRDELSAVIGKSLDLLEDYGFGRARSFRAGGWMSSDAVRSALVENGIQTDSSAVPVDFIRDDLWISGVKEYELIPMLDELWQGAYSGISQPFYHATSNGTIIQIPDNGALADYMTPNEMWQVIQDNYRAMVNDPYSGDRYVMIGFHLESAARFLPRIRPLLAYLRQYMGSGGVLAYANLPVFQ